MKQETRPFKREQEYLRPRTPLRQDTRSIVWAVDPFADDAAIQKKSLMTLASMYEGAEIHPIYVLSELAFQAQNASSFLRPALKPMAYRNMVDLIDSVAVEANIKRPRVLIESSASRAACARKLLRFSEKMCVDLIALSSHGRRALTRFFVGSFADEIIHSSEIPLLFSGPESGIPNQAPRVIVFPTDFSAACAEALDEIIALAAGFGAELHLFHKTVHDIDPFVQSGVHVLGGGWVSFESYFTDEDEVYSKAAEKWVERCETNGVHARFISEPFREPTSQSILEYVAGIGESAPLLAMVKHTGAMASLLLGSVTKDVIRRSPCPVYVIA